MAQTTRKELDELPISSFRGPDVNLPWTERQELTLEQKLEEAQKRLEETHAEKKGQEKVGSGTRLNLRGRSNSTESSLVSRAAAAQRLLRIQKDPRFLELREALQSMESEEAARGSARSKEASGNTSRPQPSYMRTHEAKASWKEHLWQGLRRLIQTVNMSLEPNMAERQLEEVYRWYITSKPGHAESKAESKAERAETGFPSSGFHDFCAEEVLRHPAPPGSAYFVSEDAEVNAASEHVEEEMKTLAGRQMVEARLASPKERLKDFNTKAIVRPLTARKLKDLGGGDEPNRPLTPSTMSGGGGLTARSMLSAPSAVTGASRPTSALSGHRSARATPTPRSFRRPQSAMSVDSVVAPLPHTVEEQAAVVNEEYTAPYPGTEAEWNMERRWMQRRHRAITDKVMGQERSSRLRDWAERRARAEEEISRTAEATRFQCALADRRYVEPADAEEDIEATFHEESHGRVSLEAARRPVAPRVDVSQPQGMLQATRFAVERPKPKALNSRIAHLRRIHAHLLCDEDSDSGEEEHAGASEQEHQLLSAYGAQAVPRVGDDSDVLAGVCDWWRHMHKSPEDGSSALLDEMRFNQLQEVEDIKRIFSARSVPVNARVLERALVMPAHQMNPGHLNGIYLVNTKPDLLSNPFLARKKKPLKRRGKSAKGKKGKAKGKAKKK